MNRLQHRQNQSIQSMATRQNHYFSQQQTHQKFIPISNVTQIRKPTPSLSTVKAYNQQLPINIQPYIQKPMRLNDYLTLKKVVTQSSIEVSAEQFPNLNNSPIHLMQQSVFLNNSLDHQMDLVQKEISLSSSSCLSESYQENDDGEKFACEKAFEIMQLIDQQINNNDGPSQISPSQKTPPAAPYKFSFSNIENNDIQVATNNIQNFIKNLHQQPITKQKSNTFYTSKDFSKLGSSYFGNSEASFQQRLVKQRQQTEDQQNSVYHAPKNSVQSITLMTSNKVPDDQLMSFAQPQNLQQFVSSQKIEFGQLVNSEYENVQLKNQFVTSQQIQESEHEKKISQDSQKYVVEYKEMDQGNELFEPIINSQRYLNYCDEDDEYLPNVTGSLLEQQFQDKQPLECTKNSSSIQTRLNATTVEKSTQQDIQRNESRISRIYQQTQQSFQTDNSKFEGEFANQKILTEQNVDKQANLDSTLTTLRNEMMKNEVKNSQQSEQRTEKNKNTSKILLTNFQTDVRKSIKLIKIIEDLSNGNINEKIDLFSQIYQSQQKHDSIIQGKNSLNIPNSSEKFNSSKKSIKIINDDENEVKQTFTEPNFKKKKKIIVLEEQVEQQKILGYFNYHISFLSPGNKSLSKSKLKSSCSSKKRKSSSFKNSSQKLYYNQQLRIQKLEDQLLSNRSEQKKNQRSTEYVCSSFVNLMDLSLRKNQEEEVINSGTCFKQKEPLANQFQFEYKQNSNLEEIKLLAESDIQQKSVQSLKSLQSIQTNAVQRTDSQERNTSSHYSKSHQQDERNKNYSHHLQLAQQAIEQKLNLKNTTNKQPLSKNEGYSNYKAIIDKETNKKKPKNSKDYISKNKQILQKENSKMDPYFEFKRQLNKNLGELVIDGINQKVHSRKNTHIDNLNQNPIEQNLLKHDANNIYNRTIEQVQKKLKTAGRR